VSSYISRGANAQRLLDDPAFRDSSDALERQIVEKLKSVQLDGTEATERYVLELVRCLQSAARFSKLLWSQVENGKLQEHELERKKLFRKGGI
jgi:hypothetical protein